ncbi:MAG: hypothetical protein WCL16_10780 [bacterium]
MKLTQAFFEDIRGIILSARATVARGVDLVYVQNQNRISQSLTGQLTAGNMAQTLSAQSVSGPKGQSFDYHNQKTAGYRKRPSHRQFLLSRAGEITLAWRSGNDGVQDY